MKIKSYNVNKVVYIILYVFSYFTKNVLWKVVSLRELFGKSNENVLYLYQHTCVSISLNYSLKQSWFFYILKLNNLTTVKKKYKLKK